MRALPHRALLCLAALLPGGIALRARTEPSEVNVATVGCGDYCYHARLVAKTFLAQAKLDGGARQTLHIFTDNRCIPQFDTMRAKYPLLFEAGNVVLYDSARLNITTPGRDLSHHKMNVCNTLRVYLPRLFPHLRKLLYMDSDAVVVSSLRPLFKLPMSVYMMAEDGGSVYNDKDSANCGTWANGTQLLVNGNCHPWIRGVNDGVFMVDLDRWRSLNLDATVDYWMALIANGTVKFKYHEQDMFNLLSLQHPEYLTRLPCEANAMPLNRWQCFYDNFQTGTDFLERGGTVVRNDRQPIIVHAKFGHSVGFQQWVFLFTELMHAVERIANNAGTSKVSLCAEAKCGSYIAEASYHDECWGGNKKRVIWGQGPGHFNCTPIIDHYVQANFSIKRSMLSVPFEELGGEV